VRIVCRLRDLFSRRSRLVIVVHIPCGPTCFLPVSAMTTFLGTSVEANYQEEYEGESVEVCTSDGW